MSEKKRKPKRPKAMQAKPRVTTEATKHKLPRPKRKAALSDAALDALHGYTPRPTPPRVQCPRCEKWVPDHPHDIHTCYDAKAFEAELATPSPIAGQPLDGIGSCPAPEFRAILCGEDVQRITPWFEQAHTTPSPDTLPPVQWDVPDTTPYPWPVRVLNWVDDKLDAAQRWLATRLRRLADAVEGTQ